jgi:hypothetical protein
MVPFESGGFEKGTYLSVQCSHLENEDKAHRYEFPRATVTNDHKCHDLGLQMSEI